MIATPRGLSQAFCVLHRLCAPRHPPTARSYVLGSVQFSRCGTMMSTEGGSAPSKLDSERGTDKRRCSLKGGDPGARSRTPTLLRLNPPHRSHLRHPTGNFGCNRLGWFDGRCVQGPGTYSPRCS